MPNFYDPKFGHGGHPRTGGVKKLLIVSRLKPWKNVDLAISAIAGTGLELDIVGDGGCRQDLQRLASGIQEDVRFHGWVANNDLSNFYEAADLFIHSARIPEPFGRTILEAMQHNLPVIVPDVGAPAWVAGDAGCIYSTDDIESLRSQIKTLVDNNSLYVQRSAACADELQRFAPATTMDRMVQTYRRVINKSHTNR
jgi:glycosyltransferase involved in cell wall biosynthesis